MTLSDYLSETFVRNALIAATLVAITAGLIGPVVIMRDLAFAVHGSAELAFTGAAAGLRRRPTIRCWARCWARSWSPRRSGCWETV